MVIKKKKFQARCINNKYTTFGNHTGFRYVDCTYSHLVVGEWYDFERTKYGFNILINGKPRSCTGYTFSIPDGKYTPECYEFYKFFSTIEEQRDMKLKSMGI